MNSTTNTNNMSKYFRYAGPIYITWDGSPLEICSSYIGPVICSPGDEMDAYKEILKKIKAQYGSYYPPDIDFCIERDYMHQIEYPARLAI